MTCDSVSLTNPRFNKEMYHIITQRINCRCPGLQSDHSKISVIKWNVNNNEEAYHVTTNPLFLSQCIWLCNMKKQRMKGNIYHLKITLNIATFLFHLNYYIWPKSAWDVISGYFYFRFKFIQSGPWKMCYFKKVINVSIFAMSCVCSSLPIWILLWTGFLR